MRQPVTIQRLVIGVFVCLTVVLVVKNVCYNPDQYLKLNLDTSTGPSGEEPRPVSRSADHKADTQGPTSALPQHTDLKLNLDTSTGPSGEEPRPVSKFADHKPDTEGPTSALPQHTDLKLNLDTSTGPSGEEPRPVSESADRKVDTEGPTSALPQHTENNSGSSDPEVKVILLSYMRSGSTLTGEVFNQHPRVFFFYEPLWTVDFSFLRANEPAHFFHRDPMKHDPEDKTQVRLLKINIISSILHCDFKRMYTQPLTEPLAYLKSRTLQPFKQCKDSNPGWQGLYGCLPVLRQACTSAKVIAMKVVRLPMELAATFLKADPKVKVIHLVRDPRAVLNSRQPSGISKLYPQTASHFCDYVTKDLKDSIPLKQQFPGRVLTVRYEDLAQRPLAFSARLLTFAQLDMPPAVKNYVNKMTSSNDTRIEEKPFETYRKNASLTAAAWRRTVQFDFVEDVDRSCGELYSLAGYLPLDSQPRLRNMNEPYFEDYRQAPIKLWDD